MAFYRQKILKMSDNEFSESDFLYDSRIEHVNNMDSIDIAGERPSKIRHIANVPEVLGTSEVIENVSPDCMWDTYCDSHIQKAGKSKRMLSVEKAAHFISLHKPSHNVTDMVKILKDYFLRVEDSPSEVPTYDDFAWDICYNPEKIPNYTRWKINRPHNYMQEYCQPESNLVETINTKIPHNLQQFCCELDNLAEHSRTLQQTCCELLCYLGNDNSDNQFSESDLLYDSRIEHVNNIDNIDISGERPSKIQRIENVPEVLGTSEVIETVSPDCTWDTDCDSHIQKAGESKRMFSIRKAAHFISLRKPSYNFTESVKILKGYLLKLEHSLTEVPTYEKFAWDFCYDPEAISNYSRWKINNHKFIDDVLFKSDFDVVNTFGEVQDKFYRVLSQLMNKLHLKDFEKYKNSSLLRGSLTAVDFLYLKIHLQGGYKITHDNSKIRANAAVYRLALRECEEEWIDNNVTLYPQQFVERFFGRKSDEHYYTFKKVTEFSNDIKWSERNYYDLDSNSKNLIQFTLEMENQAGVANVDRLFDYEFTGSYLIPANMKFLKKPIEQKKLDNRLKLNILLIKMLDKRLKEDKMVDMVKALNNIFDNYEHLFRHYN